MVLGSRLISTAKSQNSLLSNCIISYQSAMNRLPQELLCLIVQNVPYESLENLRLVNKALSDAAAPPLFKSIPVWISVRSLERLTAISEHPQLSKYPKQIFFSTLSFIDYNDDILYEGKIKDFLEHKRQYLSHSMRALTLAKHMSAYRGYIEMQRLLSANDLDTTILSRAFSQLPHLETLQVGLWDPTIGSDEVLRAFGTINPGDLLTFDSSHTLPVLIKALAASTTKIKAFKLVGERFRPCQSLSRSIDYCWLVKSPLLQLLSRREDQFSFPAGLSTRAVSEIFCDENINVCKDALRCVRELRIGSIGIEADNPSSKSMIISALHKLMQYAQGLEVVTLDGVWVDLPGDVLRHSLDILMPSCVLNSIQELNLRFYDTTVVALCDLFRQNRYTLITAHFYCVRITGSDLVTALDWSTALTQLRTIDFSCLKVITLSYCNGLQEDVQVQDYILKKTNTDPLVGKISNEEEGMMTDSMGTTGDQ